jgi:uncharacterized protein (DUF2336 family)
MRPQESETLIAELEIAVRSGSPETRVAKLRQVTDLFLHGPDRLNEEQVKVFDEVLCHLSAKIENRALAELSRRLAPVGNAPIEMVGRLARNGEIQVAAPVLSESKRLNTGDLIEIAQTQSQLHLLAISRRDSLETLVTDVVVERGDSDVVHTLATNTGARFSDTGYGMLVQRAEGDDSLCEKVGLRADILFRLLRDLLARATETARLRLLSLIPAGTRDELTRILETISNALVGGAKNGRDSTAAESFVRALHSEGRLDDAAILDFANRGRFAEVIAAVALLCSSQIQVISDLLMGARNDAILVPCKAANLSWPTVEAILRNRHGKHTLPEQIVDLARNDFNRLTVATAQKTLRFLQVRATVTS